MKTVTSRHPRRAGQWRWTGMVLVLGMILPAGLNADFTLEVTDPSGTAVTGFRYLVEIDNTNQPVPGALVSDSLAVDIHASHAPVVKAGSTGGSSVVITIPQGAGQRYCVSVLPDGGYTMSGANVTDADQNGTVTVIVNAHPVPTAQISILVFKDIAPINNETEVGVGSIEEGLEDFAVIIHDAGGQIMLDAFGNPLGTTYQFDGNGDPLIGGDGQPVVDVMGNSSIMTNAVGEALVKYIVPGKYGIQIIPPPADPPWVQTTTIEGTPTIDAWVKANEPPVFVEFGPATHHIVVGFVRKFDDLALLPSAGGQTGTITGRLVYNHFAPPPMLQGFFPGPPVQDGWIGLNEAFSRQGVYAAPADNPETGEFTISGIPTGTYQLVTWDKHLDSIFGFNSVAMPDMSDPQNPNWDIDLGDVLTFAWYGTLEGTVFFDEDEDGFRDPGELGMPLQSVGLRFRDGSMYQATETDLLGNYYFTEVFPFFKWLVPEVDFLRHKSTGVTNVVDAGGDILGMGAWPWEGKRTPQEQVDGNGAPVNNPNTGDNLSRTETGEVLTQAMFLFLGQNNRIDWGKYNYEFGRSGGITGITFYAVTRAEDDPAYAAGEEWEAGIPRVQMNLYQSDFDGNIIDLDGDGGPTLADRDNYPIGWINDPGNPAAKGDEDEDWDDDGVFDPGDAVQITYSDSWDDDVPTGCIQNLPVVHGQEVPECFDNFGTWNQIRPGVFDGGYAFASHFPGGIASGSAEVDDIPPGLYVVEAAAPAGYEILKEEDKNVDYGDEPVPGTRALPPPCVGDLHEVPPFLSLFGDIEAPFAGEDRPLCDRKMVIHSGGQNTAVDFFLFTYVPKAARAVGFINNDLAAEFDTTSPVFGEKQAPSWIPVSFQDYAGNEIVRIYSDEFGAYNALLPSTFTVNVPSPTGVSPHMISFVVNHPGPIPDPNNPGEMIIDPYFDPSYSQTPYTSNFESGKTTYLDTPVLPVAAFAGYPTRTLDTEPVDGTPAINSVMGPNGGPVVCGHNETIVITSMGDTEVPNPDYDPAIPGSELTIVRDFGFGPGTGQAEVTVAGKPLRITSWDNNAIVARPRGGNGNATVTGQLIVTRSNGLSTPIGITLHVLDCGATPVTYLMNGGGTWPDAPIQDAIDAAAAGTLIVLGPGTYKENPIIYKNVKLQGSGAGSTFLNGNPVPFERVTAWHEKVNQLMDDGLLFPVDAEEIGRFFEATEAPCIMVHGHSELQDPPNPPTWTQTAPGLVDGLTIMGGVSGGGVFAAGHDPYLQISNNRIMNCQGTFGGGITVGFIQIDSDHTAINIHHNLIAKNGGINGGGGVTIFRGATDYRVADNVIIANFSRNVGGGVAHFGLNDGGTIERNKIVFNEVFYGAQIGGEGGGIFLGTIAQVPEDPGEAAFGSGTGNVSIVSNLIQGNLAGSGSGGGIRAVGINGDDLLDDGGNPVDPAEWYSLDLLNNMIVNNVAALRGGGVALQDATKVNIIHNTIANNDSTSTAALAFPPGTLLQSNPQGAGLVTAPHSPDVALASGQVFSDPLLVNNILWHNRSFSWDGTLNGMQGELVPDPAAPNYWDLQVVGGANQMSPQYCVLSDTAGYDPSNVSGDPRLVTEYQNGLLTAAVIDEGGNAITVRYRELSAANGDYHILVNSSARNAAQGGFTGQFPALAEDYDGDDRPSQGGPDIGADERVGGGGGGGNGNAAAQSGFELFINAVLDFGKTTLTITKQAVARPQGEPEAGEQSARSSDPKFTRPSSRSTAGQRIAPTTVRR